MRPKVQESHYGAHIAIDMDSGPLTLPPALAGELGLPHMTTSKAIMTNSREDICDVHDATVPL